MAGDSFKREMTSDFFHFILLVHTLQHLCSRTEAVESHSQAFIQTDNHLTYIVGDVNGIALEVKPGQRFQDLPGTDTDEIYLSNTVRFEPPMLNFQEQAVGMPHMEQVLIQNTDTKNSLLLLSISGSTMHFHCSFFQDKNVPPGGNTTFDVVFLARQIGNVENTLYVHTSQGSFKYQVFGVGIPNPYRLRPYLGARVPINTSFTPLINMHNPHSTTLQVLEMFSSEGDLHLELPGGEREAPRKLWEIPPYETKTVMKANFIGRVENNHTAFIRIKTNQETKSEMLILPIEVEVSSAPGLYTPTEVIDFGIMRTLDGPKTVALNLVNTGGKAVHITSVSAYPPNDAIAIDFRPTKVQADPLKQTTVAHISYRAVKALHPRQWSGKIVIRSKNNVQKLVIPYQVSVHHGSLVYNVNSTYFFSARALKNVTRMLTVTNTFNFSIVIYNVTLSPEVHKYFTIQNFSQPVTINPQQTVTPFLLRFHPNVTQLHFNTIIEVHTNTSVFQIPVVVYSGLLKIIQHRPEKFKGQLDFGTMGVGEKKMMIFTIRNDNPVDMVVGEFRTNMNNTSIEILGMERGNATTLTRLHNRSEIETDPLIIKPYHFCVFSVNLIAPDYEGDFSAEVIIVTQFQDIFLPMKLRTAEGSLNAIPEKINFDRVYPGKIPFRVLQMHSTFESHMQVTRVSFQPDDSRFIYQQPSNAPVILEPHKINLIGKIFFHEKGHCLEDCYVGLSTNTAVGHQWLVGLTLDREVADTDQYLYTRLQQKWELIEKLEQNIINVTIELDTNQVRGFLFSAQAHLHWPSLVRKCKIKFPLTQIGNISISDFIVENPGDIPVLIQILPLSLYPNSQTIIDMLGHKLSADLTDYIETDDPDIFTLPDLEDYNKHPNNPVPGFRIYIEKAFGVRPHRHTITTILAPGAKVKVRVGFQPKDDISRTSLILIRNNLTVVDPIVMQGQGGRGEMKLNSRKPGNNSPLQFDMTEKHLKNCDKKKHTKSMVPNFTVRKSFTLRNTGELPFYVHRYFINDFPCEGYGFRVLDCEGFEMSPNSTHKIDIAFTPDFTMSRIQRMLTVYTSLGPPFNYTLQATVPPHMLSKCSAALPRPNWEPVLYYSIVCLMGFLLFCILVAAYFEADRIFVADIFRRKIKLNGSQMFDKTKVFDLKPVAGIAHINSASLKTPVLVQPPMFSPLPKPVLEIANGHVHRNKAKGDSFFVRFLNLIKNFSFTRNSHLPKCPTVECENSQDKHSRPSNTKQQLPEMEKKLSTQESVISEKSIIPQKIKKTKAAKRHNDLSLYVDSQLADRRTGRYSNAIDSKKTVTDQTCKNGVEKIHHDKGRSLNKNDGSPLPEELLKTEGKIKNKRRNRPKLEALNTNRLTVKENVDDKDETSSTSTESSTGDGEDKSSSPGDSTPEPAPVTSKVTKKKRRSLERRYSAPLQDDCNSYDDFQLTSKSKAHKRIKVNPKETYGGNILQPSSLELPYSLETKVPTDTNKKDTILDVQKLKKPLKSPLVKSKSETDADTSDWGIEATDPIWDSPSLDSVPDDLSELAVQTEAFALAQRHLKTMTAENQVNGFSPDTPSHGSRSSSYSDIVSNNNNNNNNSETANGKIEVKSPTDKRFVGNFNPFTETTVPGTIGSKTITPTASVIGTGKLRTPWAAASTADTLGPSFGLHTIQEGNRSAPTMIPEGQADPYPQSEYPFALPPTSMENNLYGFVGNIQDNPHSLTMMQRLQWERRQRVREHHMKVLKGEDWPGFDVPLVRSDSLWDAEYNPAHAWSTATDSPPASTANSLWSTLTNSGWNSLMSISSIWSGTPTTTSSPTIPSDTSFSASEGGSSANTSSSQIPETAGSFNLFDSMTDIWGPQASGSSPSWGFPAKEDEGEK